MKHMYTLIAVLALLRSSYCIKKTKCQVVKALRDEGVPNTDLRNWLCLVQHESGYHYDALNVNSNGSKDYGIFQLNNRYFCDRPNGTSSSICWRVNTYGCADTCASFRNSDITNDANCAVRIKKCGGFGKWYGWRNHCSDVSGSAYNYSNC